MSINILAIESSCDDTSAAVFSDGKLLSNIMASQEVHSQYGGVVPELASREHQKHIVPTVDLALKEAKIDKSELSAIAFTLGPGLIGSLMVGTSFAKSMALALGIPIITVNHMQAHILAHFIEEPQPSFPFICLTVSGGHSQLVLVKDYLNMEIIGETIDDAAGEAFDKTGKILGLGYPAGPLVDKLAAKGNPDAFTFAEPRVPEFDYSFSGLKTSVLYFIQKQLKEDEEFIEKNLNDLCASIQKTIIKILMKNLIKVAKKYEINEIAIAGGVSANSGLRKELESVAKEKGWNSYIPHISYCTDNAAMIGITAHYKYLNKEFADQGVIPDPRLKF